MKRRMISCGVAMLFLLAANAIRVGSNACCMAEKTDVQAPPADAHKGAHAGKNDNKNNCISMKKDIVITVGGTSFSATLETNEAARAFAAMLPLTLHMSELNGNEKYHYLSARLPVSSSRPGTIRTGDMMLYGASCVVLFYDTFTSGYAYTRLGRINNPEGLAAALGRADVSVRFAMAEKPE